MIVDFTAEVWLWDARRIDTWTFVTLPVTESETIRDQTEGLRRGFGSLRVRVTLGASTWTTSTWGAARGG